MVGHGGSSAGSYLAGPTSPIPSHCASIVATSTVRVKLQNVKVVLTVTWLHALVSLPHSRNNHTNLFEITERGDVLLWPSCLIPFMFACWGVATRCFLNNFSCTISCFSITKVIVTFYKHMDELRIALCSLYQSCRWVIGWISDSYCSIKPLCSGMGEVVPARYLADPTSPMPEHKGFKLQ